MNIQIWEIPSEGWAWAIIATLAIIAAYNLIATACKHFRDARKQRNRPVDGLRESLNECDRKLDNDKRRIDDHDRQLNDMRRGLIVTCAGVQALLEHAVHNGNTDEMRACSDDIDKWLRERPY